MGDLTWNFSTVEFLRYDGGKKIAVQPPGTQPLLRLLCQTLLQPIRDYAGALQVTSGYRTPEWNAHVKGSPTSSHLWQNGHCCADIKPANPTDRFKIVEFVLQTLPFAFGELIYYGETDHLHVGLPTPKDHGQLLFLHRPKKVQVELPWRGDLKHALDQLQALIAQHPK